MRKRKFSAGAVTLILTAMMLFFATLIVIFASGYSALQQKAIANLKRNSEAYEAAEAGLEFGIVYLQQNSAVILANPLLGHIPNYTSSSTTNVTLANGSRFSITYSNPVANNYSLIEINSTGVSADNSSTSTVRVLVQSGSHMSATPNVSLVTQGNVSMSGNALFTNLSSNQNILTGGSLSITGNATTVTSGGVSSSATGLGSDVSTNNSALAGMSVTEFFNQYFSGSMDSLKASATMVYSNSSSTNYSSDLNGVTDQVIWIDQTGGTASISGTTTIGSATHPVLMVVNGNFNISGNVTIYGFVFVTGTSSTETTTSGNVGIHGAMATSDNLVSTGNSSINYSSTILSAVQNNPALTFFAKVPGSWRSF